LRERIGPSARAARTPLGAANCDAHQRTRPLSRSATPVPSPARGPKSKTEIGEEAGTQFVPSMRAYSAHNRLHVNTPAPCRFAQSYMVHDAFGVRTGATTKRPPMIRIASGCRRCSAAPPCAGRWPPGRFLAPGGGHQRNCVGFLAVALDFIRPAPWPRSPRHARRHRIQPSRDD